MSTTYPKALTIYSATPATNWLVIYLEMYTNYNPNDLTWTNVEQRDFLFNFINGGISFKSQWDDGKMIHFEVTNSSMSFQVSEGEYFDTTTGNTLSISDFANLVYAAVGI